MKKNQLKLLPAMNNEIPIKQTKKTIRKMLFPELIFILPIFIDGFNYIKNINLLFIYRNKYLNFTSHRKWLMIFQID